MTGPSEILVEVSSASHGRELERGGWQVEPIDRSHSDMVKFTPYDENYYRVLSHLVRFAKLAGEIVQRRFADAASG